MDERDTALQKEETRRLALGKRTDNIVPREVRQNVPSEPCTETYLTNLKCQIEMAQVEKSELQKELQIVTGQRDKAMQLITPIRQELDRLNKAYADEKQRADELVGKVHREPGNASIGLLQQELEMTKEALRRAQTESAESVKQRDKVLRQVTMINAEMDHLIEKSASEKDRFASLEQAVQQANNKFVDMQAAVRCLEEERDALKAALQEKDHLISQKDEEERLALAGKQQEIQRLQQSHQQTIENFQKQYQAEIQELQDRSNQQITVVNKQFAALKEEFRSHDDPVTIRREIEMMVTEGQIPQVAKEAFATLCEVIDRAEQRDKAWIGSAIADDLVHTVYMPPSLTLWADGYDMAHFESWVRATFTLQRHADTLLRATGFCPIVPATGTPFDPALHEAGERDVSYIDDNEALHNCVDQVLRIGFQYDNHSVVRKARVTRFLFTAPARAMHVNANSLRRDVPINEQELMHLYFGQSGQSEDKERI